MRPPALIRSGWWVAVAGVLLTAASIWLFLSATPDPLDGEAPPPGTFDLTTATVPRDLIVRVMPPDGLRTLLEPPTLTPAQVERINQEERGKLLVVDDRVIGVAHGSEARAYPLRLMRWHEVVNDTVGGKPVVITYGPLCDSVAVYSRVLAGEIVELGLSGLLYNSNALLYDARVGDLSRSPLWAQLTGVAVAGVDPRDLVPLEALAATLTTWGAWLERHPHTTVMAPQPDLLKVYKRDPYHSYFGSDVLHYPVEPLPPDDGPGLKDRVLVVVVADVQHVFDLPSMATAAGAPRGRVRLEAGQAALEVEFDAELGVAAVASATPDVVTATRSAFWFAWHSLEGTFPDSIHSAG